MEMIIEVKATVTKEYIYVSQADLNGDEMVSFEEFHDIFFEGQ